jgi:hypothetical protein
MAIAITVKTLGRKGVNVDKDPFDLDNDELTRAQNAIPDPAKGESAIRKRYGLAAFNTSDTGAVVLGGCPVPGNNVSTGGSVTVYIGRSPSS